MRVAVVGGGIAGLAAAAVLGRRGARVVLVEAASRLGGQVWTERANGFLVEHGAEGFTPGSTAALALCERLGLAERLVEQCHRRALLLRDGRLEPLSDGEAARRLGIQVAEADRGNGLLSLRGGMGELVEALVRDGGERTEYRLGVSAIRLRAGPAGWRLRLSDGRRVTADAAVLALPAAASARLLSGICPDTSTGLAALTVASSLAVTLALPEAAVPHPLDASGFVVGEPASAHDDLRACTFSSSKFPGRASAGWCLLRAFFRPDAAGFAAGDAEWRARAERALRPVLGCSATASYYWVSRWSRARPLYATDHAERIRRATAQLRRLGPLELAGAAVRASGIEGAIASGEEAAARVLAGARTAVREGAR